jgi:hypothetical protein
LRYLKKILTVAEIEFILGADNPDAALWSLWACKETAYKIARKISAAAAFLPCRWNARLNPIVSAFPAACGGVSERLKKNIYSLRIEDSPQLAAENVNMPAKEFWEGEVTTGEETFFVRLFCTENYVHCLGSDNPAALGEIVFGVDQLPASPTQEITVPSLFVRDRLIRRLADYFHADYRNFEIRREKEKGELHPPVVYSENRKYPVDISLSHDGLLAAYAFSSILHTRS